MAKGDSAASHHYWRDQDSHVLSTIRPSLGPSVLLPNGDKISSTKAGTLPLHSCLTDRASTAMILPSLKSASLISIGQLCDDNCEVFLNKTSLVAVKNDDIILEGIRNPTDGLWDIPVRKTTLHEFNHPLPPIHPGIYPKSPTVCGAFKLPFNTPMTPKNKIFKSFRHFHQLIDDNEDWSLMETQQQTDAKVYFPVKLAPENPKLSVIIQKKHTHLELAQYLHAACFSPVKSTIITAVKKHHFKS